MKKTAIYYSNIFLEHIVPNGHPENNNRIKFIIKNIKEMLVQRGDNIDEFEEHEREIEREVICYQDPLSNEVI